LFCLEILKLGCWPTAVGLSGGGGSNYGGWSRAEGRSRTMEVLFPLCGFASLNYDLEGLAAAAEGGQGVGAS
jgi:hypothetical protein